MSSRFLVRFQSVRRLGSFKTTLRASCRPFSNLVATAAASNNSDSTYRNNSLYSLPILGVLLGAALLSQNKSESCGIVGVVGGEDAVGFLLEGLTILRNRGYDSAGVATTDGHGMCLTKYASRESTSDSIDLVRANATKHAGHTTGIAHTRWYVLSLYISLLLNFLTLFALIFLL
jgi:glucosamine--fructose-6-phosphate aminotransferase (isomerizing)